MRICDLTTLFIDGGAGGVNTYLTEKAQYLTENHPQHHHTIIVPGARDTTQTLFASTVYTLRSPRLIYNPQHRVLTQFRHIKQILQATKPDLIEVDCLYFLGHVAASATARHIPLIGFYHTHLPSLYSRPLSQWLGAAAARRLESCAWAYVNYCMRPLDKILVSSNDTYEWLIQHTDRKVEQLPLGVNLHLFRPPSPLAAPLPAPGHRPVILYVGRLSQEKELDVLFEAFRILSRHGIYQLHIVGDGPLRKKTERFVNATPHASYIGFIPYGKRLAEAYQRADVFVMPSRNETFGLAVLEALASGIPVVAAKQGGPTHLLPPDTGALATPGDPLDFATKLAHVLGKSANAHHYRTYVEQHFSWQKTFARLLDIYENLLERAKPSRPISSA
jgi:alpha-1,6-mannosyltransferase